MKNHIAKMSAWVVGFVFTSTAQAMPTTVKDWTLTEIGNFCVAYTEQKLNEQVFRFELVYEKSGQFPVETLIRENPETSNALAIKMTTEVKPIQSYSFVTMANSDGSRIFWQVPKNTEALVAYIKRQTRLSMKVTKSDNTIAALMFSLRGSSATVDALIKECAQGKSIVATAFDKDFISVKAVDQLDPLKVNETRSKLLRDLYLQGHKSYSEKLVLQKELSTLNTKYTTLVQELAKLTGQLDQMTQKELIALQNQKIQLEGKIKKFEQDILKQTDSVKSKESELPAANAAYEQAWAEVSKIKPEYDRLAKSVKTAEAELNTDTSKSESIASDVVQKERSLEVLERELQSLSQQRYQAETEMNDFKYKVNDLEQMQRRFDTQRETRSRVDSHPVARFCERNSHEKCRSLVDNIQRRARDEVSNLYENVRDNAVWAQNIIREKQNLMSQLDYQIRDKQNYEIPRVRSDLNNLRSQQDQADRQVRQSRAELETQRSAFSQYKSRVGWDQKKATLDAKTAAVAKIQKQIEALEAELAVFEKGKTKAVNDLATTEKSIETLLAKIRAGQDRSSEINKTLEPYFADKKRIEMSIQAVEQNYQLKKQEFASELIRQ